MRNGQARLKEEFPDEYANISVSLARAIRADGDIAVLLGIKGLLILGAVA